MPLFRKSPLNYPANDVDPIRRFLYLRQPTNADYKQYIVGDEWLDKSSDDWWKLCYRDATLGLWRKMCGTAAAVELFTPDVGGQVGPDGLNNINIFGGGGLTVTGTPATNTLTIAPTGGGNLLETLTGDAGGAINADALNNINILGGVGLTMTGNAGTNTLTLDVDAQENIIYVAKHGNDANSGLNIENAKLTIQAAVTIAIAGDTVLVSPGIYTETITHVASDISIFAMGNSNNCIIRQADANIIDFNTRTGILYKFFRIECTAATTAINVIQGSTGEATFKDCHIRMVCATDIAAAVQPSVGALTGAGLLNVNLGYIEYLHTGNGGGTALKSAFIVVDGAVITIDRIANITINNSGTALATSLIIDNATTGIARLYRSDVLVIDPDATFVVGLGFLGGTGIDHEYYRNTIHVIATNNTGYGFYSDDTATTSRFFYNHIHVEDTAGLSYSYYVGATAIVISQFDDLIAADGVNIVATGTFCEVSSEIDGDLTCQCPKAAGTEQISIMNTDNTATASNAALNLSVGGTTSTGDPYVNLLVTGGTEYSFGIDNTSTTDLLKITTGASPSAGTTLMTIGNNGVKDFVGFFDGAGPDLITSGSVYIVDSLSGGDVRVVAANTSVDADSNASYFARVSDNAAGDPYISFDVYDTGATVNIYTFGIDNSDSDKMKLTTAHTPSLGDILWSMTTAGERTMPLQPAFLAYNSADDANQTGNGAIVTVDFDTELYDQNADFAADTFTAPVTGIYSFEVSVMMTALNGATSTLLKLVTTLGTFILTRANPTACMDGAGVFVAKGSIKVPMTATNTAYITLQNDAAGANNNTIMGSASPYETWFSGSLYV